jgi:hypothetical protein
MLRWIRLGYNVVLNSWGLVAWDMLGGLVWLSCGLDSSATLTQVNNDILHLIHSDGCKR